MPVFNNSIEKLFLGTLNLGPAPMYDMMGGFTFYALASAVELNLFEELNKKQMSTAELAQALNCDSRGLDTLLELLETLGYMILKKKGYILTPMKVDA